jgi:RNA polymerase sigma-70 factor (ECF subfamily)
VESYRRYGAALLRKAERILQNREDAQDVVQSLFVELLSRGTHEPDLPYLYRAVTHRCLSLMRDRDNRERLVKQQQPALRGTARTACDETVIGLDLLLKLTSRLDAMTNEVLVYRFYDDMTQEGIGSLMGLSRRSVNRRLSRIREAVAELGRTSDPPGGPGGAS